jgi:ligand-binding SRPBCC domain-containing protein
MSNRILVFETTINKPVEMVFGFFSKAENLNLLTPPHLNFKIITPSPIKLNKGAIIDYQIRLYGLPFLWKTEISEWQPPFRFVDTQLKGPYKTWIHEHSFSKDGDKTIMKDRVEYLSPGLFLEPIIHSLFVKNKVKKIFDYREKSISRLLG